MKNSFLACSHTFGRARAVVDVRYIQNPQGGLLLAGCRMPGPAACQTGKPVLANDAPS